jgi:hypothetical protein
MKTLLITRDNRKQIVFTPETEFEKGLVKMFGEGFKEAQIFLGSFADCQGGWTREYENKDSLIIVFDKKEEIKT